MFLKTIKLLSTILGFSLSFTNFKYSQHKVLIEITTLIKCIKLNNRAIHLIYNEINVNESKRVNQLLLFCL